MQNIVMSPPQPVSHNIGHGKAVPANLTNVLLYVTKWMAPRFINTQFQKLKLGIIISHAEHTRGHKMCESEGGYEYLWVLKYDIIEMVILA